jgi:hypothetical protein
MKMAMLTMSGSIIGDSCAYLLPKPALTIKKAQSLACRRDLGEGTSVESGGYAEPAEDQPMYLFENALGDVFKPRPIAPTPKPPVKAPARPPKQGWVTQDGHRRFCGPPSGGTVSCDLNLKIRFRTSLDSFLREVENAYARWMSRPTAQKIVKKLQQDLKQWHQEMLSQTVLNADPLLLVVGLHYRRSNGAWLTDSSSLRQWQRLIDI